MVSMAAALSPRFYTVLTEGTTNKIPLPTRHAILDGQYCLVPPSGGVPHYPAIDIEASIVPGDDRALTMKAALCAGNGYF